MRRTCVAVATIIGVSACTMESASTSNAAESTVISPTDSTAATAAQVSSVSLVDTSIAPAVAGMNGWNYSQDASADLTGDGTPERVVITAQVEMSRGRPLWDDGQAWQVYVEYADSTRTYVYANRVQLGMLEMRLSRPDPGKTATIILIEHLPDRLRIAEATVDSARHASTRVMFERNLDPVGDIASRMR